MPILSDEIVPQEQSHPVKLRVLVIGYDPTFLASVLEFLHLLKHQVWTYENPFIAFSALRVRRNFYDLIITDLYLPEMDGFEVQKRVREEFRLPLIMVSSDDREHVILKALKLGVAHYIVKPICFNDVKNLWKFVVNVDTWRKEIPFVKEIGSGGEQSSDTIYEEETNGDHEKNNSKRKRSLREGTGPKKAKVVWTQELQARFLESVHFIGLERAVPKTILEVMNVKGLTRENVASHLQKYRQFFRRVAEKISVGKADIVDNSQMPSSTFEQCRTSIFQQQQQPPFRQNVSKNFTSSNLGCPLFRADDHQASTCFMPAYGNISHSYQPNPISHFQMPAPTFMGYPTSFQPFNYSSVNEFEFEASTNRFQTQASPLTNHLHGNSNNYGISAGFRYNNKFNNGSANRTKGLMNDSYSLVTNDYYNGGLPVELTGFDSNPNPASSTGRIDANFIGLVMNDIDRSKHRQDENKFSGREDASYVGFGITNVQVQGSSSNNAHVSQDPNEINADFNELYDMLFNDKKFVYLTQGEGKHAETSETSTNLIEEDALLKERNGQNFNNEVNEELEFDWLDLLDASAVLEDVSADEDLTKFQA